MGITDSLNPNAVVAAHAVSTLAIPSSRIPLNRKSLTSFRAVERIWMDPEDGGGGFLLANTAAVLRGTARSGVPLNTLMLIFQLDKTKLKTGELEGAQRGAFEDEPLMFSLTTFGRCF